MRWGRCLGRCINNFFVGIGVDYIVAFIVSYSLKLGYFMPCLTTLPEIVGGELPAIALQAVAFGLPGAGIAMARYIIKRTSLPRAEKGVLLSVVIALSLLPFAAIAVMTLQSMPY